MFFSGTKIASYHYLCSEKRGFCSKKELMKTRSKDLYIISWDEVNRIYGSSRITQLVIGADKQTRHRDYLVTNITSWGVCLCYSGNCIISIDGKRYYIKKGDMYIVFRNRQLSISRKSDDYRAYVIAADVSFLADVTPSTLPRLMMRIRNNPCATLSPNQQGMLRSVYGMLNSARREKHLYRDKMMESLFKMLYYEIAGIYREHSEGAEKINLRRKEHICKEFSLLVLKNANETREVSFYAGELNISPRYLSECVRQVTGHSPSGWISITVIHNAKQLLADGSLSIQQISDMLNFPNPSFFSQYFRKHTGTTPKEYRQSAG